MIKRTLQLAHLFLVLLALTQTCLADDIELLDISEKSQITFLHRNGSSGAHYLVEAIASGMASFDYDNDGDIDLYFLNGAALKGSKYKSAPENELWRNQGDMRFSRASADRANDLGYGLGVCIGDVDNDGFADIYLSNLQQNTLLLNNGDGTFTEESRGDVSCGSRVGGGASMLDIDSDGCLDIFVANYIKFSYDVPASLFRGRRVYGGPLLFDKEADNLLHNNQNGTFVDRTETSGIGEATEWGMGVVCLDFDLDGDTDIFVANDSTRNLLYENDGNGNFSDVALLTGTAYDHRGDPQGSMGVDVADFNGDLALDVFQTAYTKQLATLYQNLGIGIMEDSTLRTGAGAGTFYYVNWGTGFVDLDNDGDKDIFIANGHIHDNMDDLDDTVSYKLPNQIMENVGARFEDVSSQAGSGLRVKESSRGCIVDDLDGDGKIDIVVSNSNTAPTVLHNQSSSTSSWIQLDLVGITTNRSAVGSRVVITADGKKQVLEVHSGRSYQSHFGSRLHFGLGKASKVDQIEVFWHGSQTQTIEDLDVNCVYVIRQNDEPIKCKKNRSGQ